jgi:hypothetical protein
MKVLVAVKRVVDYNVKIRVKADKTGCRDGERQDVHESLRRDRRRGGDPLKGSRRGDRGGRRLASARPSARRRSAPRWPWAPTAASSSRPMSETAAAGGRQAAEGRGRGQGTARRSSSWASRRSTTTPTRPARCWRRCSAGRRRPSPQGVGRRRFGEVTREVDGGLRERGADPAGDRSPPTCA